MDNVWTGSFGVNYKDPGDWANSVNFQLVKYDLIPKAKLVDCLWRTTAQNPVRWRGTCLPWPVSLGRETTCPILDSDEEGLKSIIIVRKKKTPSWLTDMGKHAKLQACKTT